MSAHKKAKEIVGYANKISVVAGDVIDFKVSCYEEVKDYRADLVRIICGDKTPNGAGYEEHALEASFAGRYRGNNKLINIGSCGYINLAPLQGVQDSVFENFCFQAMVYPTLLNSDIQGVMGTFSKSNKSGVALVVDKESGAGFLYFDKVGNLKKYTIGVKIPEHQWSLISAAYDGKTGVLCLRQKTFTATNHTVGLYDELAKEFSITEGMSDLVTDCLLFAGLNSEVNDNNSASPCWVSNHFNGKIDRPRWSSQPLDASKINSLNAMDRHAKLPPYVVGCWDFSLDIASARISDLGPFVLVGNTVNTPARAVTGYNWDGQEHNWTCKPEQYGAIHFHDDDLYDAGWATDFSYEIPADLPSGIYAARLHSETSTYYIVFFVRPAANHRKSPVAFLASTATYMAYANSILGEEQRYEVTKDEKYRGDIYWSLKAHPELGRSLYEFHSDGSGVQYCSRLRPMVDFNPGTDNMWSFNLDTLVWAWLYRNQYAADVITDEDLDQQGVDLLKDYRVLVTGSHPEYMSLGMRVGINHFLEAGGRLMYLGGNGFFNRVSYSKELPGAMELRRGDSTITMPMWSDDVGQTYTSFTGEAGGFWQRTAIPEVQTTGIIFNGLDNSGGTFYKVSEEASMSSRGSFITEGVGSTISNNFGDVYGVLCADEFDKFSVKAGSPPHSLVVASSLQQKSAFSFFDYVVADMVFFECKNGGAVFSTGSISWGLGLAINDDVARVTKNVLERFVCSDPFDMPDVLRCEE